MRRVAIVEPVRTAVGAFGGTTVLHELDRRSGGPALETMCIAGGQGIAALFRGVAA